MAAVEEKKESRHKRSQRDSVGVQRLATIIVNRVVNRTLFQRILHFFRRKRCGPHENEMPTPAELRNSIDRVEQILREHVHDDLAQFERVTQQLTAIRDTGHETNLALAKVLALADQVASVRSQVAANTAKIESLNMSRAENKPWMLFLIKLVVFIFGAGLAVLALRSFSG